MNKEELINKLKNYYDEFSSKYLANCIDEYNQLFNEKYIDTKEIINLLVQNFPNGLKLYDTVGDAFDATCSASSKEFKVNKEILNDKAYFEYVLFHEFIHAISFRKNNNKQFMGFYTVEKGDDYAFKSKAFNEVFTEYVTIKRNEVVNYVSNRKYLSGYIVGVEQLKLLFKIIPEEELINCYFNCPDNLEKIFTKYKMNIEELFYTFYGLECKEYDIEALINKRGLQYPKDLLKIIDAERFLYYNIIDSIGNVDNQEKFDNKWKLILSDIGQYTLYKFDKIFLYGQLFKDLEKNKKNSITFILNEELKKYKMLCEIFENENKNEILKRLFEIYNKDYKKYFDLLKDCFATLTYTFLSEIKNNYQIYDIEAYPRAYKYLKINNTNFDDLIIEKYKSNETKTSFYVFKIDDDIYVETNYDDTTVKRIQDNLFEVKYGNNVDLFDLKNKKYIVNNVEYYCDKLY